MPTITIPKREYETFIKRQARIEAELNVLKHVILDEFDETRIRPSVLKCWEKISKNMDMGVGKRSFSSWLSAKKWLASI